MSAQIIEISSFAGSTASKRDARRDKTNYLYAGNLAIEADVSINSWGAEGNKKMTCDTCEELDSQLQDFIDGDIDDLARQRLSQHLANCQEFRERMEQYQKVKMLAGSISESQVLDQGIRSRLRDKLNSELGLKLKVD